MAPMKLPVASCVVTLVLLKFTPDLHIIVHSILIVYLHTVLSRASAHEHSQLKRQKLRVGSCTKEMLKYGPPWMQR